MSIVTEGRRELRFADYHFPYFRQTVCAWVSTERGIYDSYFFFTAAACHYYPCTAATATVVLRRDDVGFTDKIIIPRGECQLIKAHR